MKKYGPFMVAAAVLAFVTWRMCVLASPHEPLPSSTVKIVTPVGHGSGVHIGGGYVVTVAHVAKLGSDLTLSDGTFQSAEVMWVNEAYDVALLKTDDAMNSSPIGCRNLAAGERIKASGNPMHIEFVTMEGTVAGPARPVNPWKSAVPVDMTHIEGMSGGPVFDTNGNVVGLVGGYVKTHSFGMVIPSKVICDLIARS